MIFTYVLQGVFLCQIMSINAVVSGFATTATGSTKGRAVMSSPPRTSTATTAVLQSTTSSSPVNPIDEKYFIPAEQTMKTNQPTRITLTRFLANTVKQNPEVS